MGVRFDTNDEEIEWDEMMEKLLKVRTIYYKQSEGRCCISLSCSGG